MVPPLTTDSFFNKQDVACARFVSADGSRHARGTGSDDHDICLLRSGSCLYKTHTGTQNKLYAQQKSKELFHGDSPSYFIDKDHPMPNGREGACIQCSATMHLLLTQFLSHFMRRYAVLTHRQHNITALVLSG